MDNFLKNINSFLPANVQKIGHIANQSIIFRLDNGKEIKYLYFAPNADFRAVTFSSESPQREYSNAGWLGPFLHKLQETKLTKIQKNGNIFLLLFDDDLTCNIHFFSATGNAIVVTPDNKIAVAWHPGKAFRTDSDYDFSKTIFHSETEIKIVQASEFVERLSVAELDNLKKEVERYLNREKKRLKNRLKKIESELKETERVEEFKKKGELLKANYHLLKRGMASVKIKDYFSEENEEIEIELEPIKKPQENIAKYFKKAKKLERGREQIIQRIEITQAELEAIDKKCRLSLTLSDVCDLKKLLPEKKSLQKERQKTKNKPTEKIRSYVSSDGFTILAGKSAKDNDQLTVRVANGNDMWMHTRNRSGSHVVIRAQRGKEFPKQTLIEAAKICALLSKARDDNLEDVTYVLKKHVTKPKGMKPGSVLVAGGKTITVQHNERAVRKWMRENSVVRDP